MNTVTIPFNKPSLVGQEMEYMLDCVQRGHIAGDGEYTRRCTSLLTQALGSQRVLLTTSCTHALELSALLLDIRPGDEVLVPSFTFVSTVNPFVLRGAKPVFVDIRPDTLNLDETRLDSLISARTKAIVPVHYAGVGCAIDVILDISRTLGIRVVEDNAHGLYGKFKGKYLGTFGALAGQSFHETKNFTCGEGGALIINEAEYIERAEILREKGTDRGRFLRGQVDKYSWVDMGSSYLPSDILSAFLFAQLQARHTIQAERRVIWEYYHENLRTWADQNEVRLPFVPVDCEQPYHMYYILLPSLERRQALISHLHSNGITAVFHYLPLHLSKMGRQFGGRKGDCPVTEDISDRLLRLPFYNTLSRTQQSQVISSVTDFKV